MATKFTSLTSAMVLAITWTTTQSLWRMRVPTCLPMKCELRYKGIPATRKEEQEVGFTLGYIMPQHNTSQKHLWTKQVVKKPKPPMSHFQAQPAWKPNKNAMHLCRQMYKPAQKRFCTLILHLLVLQQYLRPQWGWVVFLFNSFPSLLSQAVQQQPGWYG